MSNILITFEVKDNTTDNNLQGLTTVLAEMNTQFRVVKASCVVNSDIEWSDVYIANRPNSIYSLNIARAAKDSGRYVVVALDDDIINLPESHPDYWKRNYTLACLKLGDALMSPNHLLMDDYCDNNNLKRVLTIAYVNKEDVKPLHPIGKKIRIVYPAGRDHVNLFNRYIQPFFDQLVKTFSGKIDVTFVGIEPQVESSKDIHFVKGMPYKDYLEYMKIHDFDIGLAPLDDDPFCARKYFAKYIEYGKYGILGLYSNVKPYTYAVKDGYNGILISGGDDQWESCLVEILSNKQRISELTANAQHDLIERYSLENAMDMLRKGCPELEAFHVNKKADYSIGIINVAMYNIRELLTKISYHLRHDGLLYFIK